MQSRKPTRKKPTLVQTKQSGSSSTPLSGKTPKLSGSLPNLPNLGDDMTSITLDTTANQNGKNSPNPNQSPKNATHGLGQSASGKGLSGIAAINANKRYAKLQEQLKDAVASIGGGMLVMGMARQSETLQADGMVLVGHADSLAGKLTDVARENEQVYKALAFLMSSSVYGALLLEFASIAMAIASNHGANIPGLPGSAPAPDLSGISAQNGATVMTPDQWFTSKGA